MRQRRDPKALAIMYSIGTVLVIWFALLIAPYSATRDTLFANLGRVLQTPLDIKLHELTPKCILVCLFVYGVCILVHETSRKNYRRGEEHGSARWATSSSVTSKLADKKSPLSNRLFTQNTKLGYDGHVHHRNLNTMVVGGSGAGKTRYYGKPNIMQANTSYVVLDPKGELLRDTGGLLAAQGYTVRVLDLINPEKSHSYNPFVYIQKEDDVQKLATNIIKSTTPKDSKSQDPFWDTTAEILLKALMFYLYYEAPPEEQNFAMIMEMIRYGELKEEDDDYKSALDLLFDDLQARDRYHPAVKAYRNYRGGGAKTLKSIQITLVSHLAKFDLASIAQLTMTDELNLPAMGREKTALFAVIPDNDTSYNFLVSILYMQLFQQLYYQADSVFHGRLPVHVHFLMDEFANVALPPDFQKLLATMRSREISVSIIIQNIAQLKELFKDSWENVRGNCDTLLYLGGNEQSTHKMISEMLGKETIDTNTYGHSKGRNGSFSTNDQTAGRDLMTPDEVAKLPDEYAILFARGFSPVLDRKYDLYRHPNIKQTVDGGAPMFIHGTCAVGFALSKEKCNQVAFSQDELYNFENRCEILSDEEIELFYDTQAKGGY